MDMQSTGRKISEQRKKLGLTQEQLAEKVGVSAQAVSKWENGHNLPDIENLIAIADILKLPHSMLITDEKSGYPLDFRQRLFNENNMFTRVKTIAQMENLGNTLTALGYMREKHSGQYRKGYAYATEKVEYINHPLMMACHAHAMGIKDDAVLAAILLHDVVEDTSADVGDLPVSDEIKEIVSLLTFRQLPGKTKAESKEIYYSKIIENKKACMVKVIDRCSNVSTMSGCFKREKIVDYINETEKYIIPLLTTLKNRYPEYGDPAFLVKYHIISLLESIKALL